MSKPSAAVLDLNALRAQYADKLPGNIRHIRSLWDNLLYVKWDDKAFLLLRRLVHNLAGTSATHGFSEIGSLALGLDQQLQKLQNTDTLPSERERSQVTGCLQRLTEMLETSHNLEALDAGANLTVAPSIQLQQSTRVLMLEDDADHAAIVKLYLEQHGCEVQVVEDSEALQAATDKQTPDVLLLDIMLPGHPTGGIEVLADARKSDSDDTPVLFMSARGDLEARLAAVRAGGSGYFVKPIDLGELAKKIENLKEAANTQYRVLIIDDDSDLASYHAMILQNAGMMTRELANPLQLLHVLNEFRPDLVLVDLYMPECNGGELAQVIRQDSVATDLPILYISGEQDAARQNAALGQGGDAFLVKPVAGNELIDAVANRVKRARWLKQRLQYLGKQDHQTGLINQHALLSRLETAINELAGAEVAAALLFVEIDAFRALRDQSGITAAEQLVTHVAGIIRSEMGPAEQIARLGESSFVVLMPGVSSATALAVSNRLRKTVASRIFRAASRSIPLTVSIGIAPLTEYYQHGDEWLSGAAIACDIARNSGKDKSYLHQPASDRQSEQEENNRCADLLRSALESDSLRCVYQPIASLHGDAVESYDLMVRMNDSDGREVLPARFLPVAEQQGLSAAVDRWVTHHAARVLAERYAAGYKTVFFVKLSAATFADLSFGKWIKEQLEHLDLPAQALVFEFAENCVSEQLDNAKRLCSELRSLGCSIALEHFGSSLGSIELMEQFTVDYVKIDGSFIHDLVNNHANQDSIREVLKPAKDRGISVIASFVEDASSLSILWQCGVQLIQGNFLQEPSSLMSFTFNEEEV
jgi:diguanylate cyclase (GGDEF)-like protein